MHRARMLRFDRPVFATLERGWWFAGPPDRPDQQCPALPASLTSQRKTVLVGTSAWRFVFFSFLKPFSFLNGQERTGFALPLLEERQH